MPILLIPGSTAKLRCNELINTLNLKYFEIAEIDPSPMTGMELAHCILNTLLDFSISV